MDTLRMFMIDKFVGVNKGTTETLLDFNEASNMLNWEITDDYKLEKMHGYVQQFASLGAHRINGMWQGNVNGVPRFVFACNGRVFEHNLTTRVNTDIGAVANTFPTTFFVARGFLYIMDGVNFFVWGGSGNITPVLGYIPVVLTASPPSGGGTILEHINYISGAKTQRFSANGTATVYQLAELAIDSVDTIFVNGVLRTTGFTVNLANGTVTFTPAPTAGVNNVVITWTKTIPGDREVITRNLFYGGVFFARHWVYGNPTRRNTRFPSGVTMAGVSDPTYWPKFAESDIGSFEITGMVTQYGKQLIFTSGDTNEASAWSSEQQQWVDPNTGVVLSLFPVTPLNVKIGNIAKGQVQMMINDPLTVWRGVYRWVSTNVADEKNAVWMSRRVQNDLESLDLSTAITVDWHQKGQYWLCVGRRVWVYNYRADTWHILEFADTPTCFEEVNGILYFGTTNGQVMRFDESTVTFNGAPINAIWESGFYNFEAHSMRKFIQRAFVTLLPRIRTHVEVTYQTDLDANNPISRAAYSMATFDRVDFGRFSFATNYSPRPFRFKWRVKKVSNLRLIIQNREADAATVLGITLPVRVSGEIRNRG